MSFEITKGDFGRTYRAIIENADLSDCSASLFVWNKDETLLINAGACTVSYEEPNTYVDYVIQKEDFAEAKPGICDALIKFEKADIVERTIKFKWKIYEGEPQS